MFVNKFGNGTVFDDLLTVN